MPLRIFRNRNRSGALLIMLCVGTAMFGMFFFLSLFVQTVWGYSALKAGVAYLPMVGMIMLMAGVSSQLVPRIGARPLLLAGSAISAGGMFWLSQINEHSTYAGGLLGPMMVTAAGLGMLFMPLTLVALSKVEDRDTGLASSLLNTGQQVGGSIGLALLGTVAWTVVANSIHTQVSAAAAAAAKTGHAVHASGGQLPRAIYDHALAVGFSRGFLVSALIALLALVITLVAIRVTRADLAGAQETGAPGSHGGRRRRAGRPSARPRRPAGRRAGQRGVGGPGRKAGPPTRPARSRGVGTAVAHVSGRRGSLPGMSGRHPGSACVSAHGRRVNRGRMGRVGKRGYRIQVPLPGLPAHHLRRKALTPATGVDSWPKSTKLIEIVDYSESCSR